MRERLDRLVARGSELRGQWTGRWNRLRRGLSDRLATMGSRLVSGLRGIWHDMARIAESHPARTAAVVLLVLGLLLWLLGYLADMAPELGGIAITVLLIDTLNEVRATQREKRALILQMGSPDHGSAVEAARILRVHGLLTDGSLRAANLVGANLKETNLIDANLRGANLSRANLRWAKAGASTQWPKGFQVPGSVIVEKD